MIWKMVILRMRGQVRNNMISSLCTFEFWCVCVAIYALENAVLHCSLWAVHSVQLRTHFLEFLSLSKLLKFRSKYLTNE